MGHQVESAGVSQGKRSSGSSWALKEMFQQEREKMERDLYAGTLATAESALKRLG